jgi:hypothetical protein
MSDNSATDWPQTAPAVVALLDPGVGRLAEKCAVFANPSLGLQIAVTGALVLLVMNFAMPNRCPRMAVAVPVLALYFAALASMVGGFLWWVWG